MNREITIAGEVFTVAVPYAAGHVITEAEANALNQSRCEAVRNNTAKAVKEALEAGDKNKAAEIVAAYDAEYVFSIRSGGGATKVIDPIEREALKVAKEVLKAKLAELSKKASDYDKNFLAQKIEEIATTNEAVRKEAAKRVKAQSKFTSEVGAELSL